MKIALKVLCLVLTAVLLPQTLTAQTKEGAYGFGFIQAYSLDGQSPSVSTARYKITGTGQDWSIHLDADLRKEGNELNQLWVSWKTPFATVRTGRFFVSDVFTTVTPFNNRVASYPRAEGALGPFFGWGLQTEMTKGSGTILVDVFEAGPNYHSLNGSDPTTSAYLKYGGETYVAIGGRVNQHLRRAVADAAYTRGRLYANAATYYQDRPEVEHRLTGVGLLEWRLAQQFAVHAQADRPPKGDTIHSLGVGLGSTKEDFYLAADREWAGERSGWAVRLQYRLNFDSRK